LAVNVAAISCSSLVKLVRLWNIHLPFGWNCDFQIA
jgi:hypothetical protein